MFCSSCGKPMGGAHLRCPACHRCTPAFWLNLFSVLTLLALAAAGYVYMQYPLPVLGNICAGLGIEMVYPARLLALTLDWLRRFGIWALLLFMVALVILRWRKVRLPGLAHSGKVLAALTWLALVITLGGTVFAFAQTTWLFPNLSLLPRARRRFAVASIEKLQAAEAAYRQANPKLGFTCKLADLRPAAAAGAGQGAARVDLYDGLKDGYEFTLSGCGAAPNPTYRITAAPASTTNLWLPKAKFCAEQSGGILAFDDRVGDGDRGCPKGGTPIGPEDEP
jgi:hypothetical protein